MTDYRLIRRQHSLPAVPESIAELRHVAASFAAEHGASDDTQHAIRLAVSEAASNAVLHAYRDDDVAGLLHLDMFVEPGRLSISVADDGVGMKPRPDSPGLGVGLPLIAQLTDELQVRSEHGTCVVMGFALPREPADA